MKRKVLAILLVLAMLFGLASFAADVKVDGKPLALTLKQQDGRILIKAQDAEKIGLKVEVAGQKVTLSNRYVKMHFEVGSNQVGVNDIKVSLDIPVVLDGQDIYLPFRFIFETLNYEVSWNKAEKMPQAKIKETKGYPISLKFGDKSFNVEAAPVKVVSMAPSITERIFDLGLEDHLVGRTKYCTYPEGALKVEEIGSMYTPDIEKIVSLKPDIILGETHFKPDVMEKFIEAGITVVAKSSPDAVAGIYDYTLFLGRIFDKQYEARAMASASNTKVSAVEYELSKKAYEKPRVYYSTGSGEYGEFGAPKNSFLGELIEICGGQNIMDVQWKEEKVVNWAYTVEDIVKNDPQIIFGSLFGAGAMKENDLFKEVTAVKNGKVYVDAENIFSKPTHRLLDEGLKKLLGFLHPEILPALQF